VAYIVSRRLVPFGQALSVLAFAPFVIPGLVLAIGFYAAYAPPPLALAGTAIIAAGLPAEKVQVVYWPHPWLENPWIPSPAPEILDPQKRFQGVGDMYHAYSSPDGIRWKKESKEKIVSGGDTSHFYYDPNTKLFRCTVKGGGTDRVTDGARIEGVKR
jgi:hypothetical protein